jgi:hypothetical protein
MTFSNPYMKIKLLLICLLLSNRIFAQDFEVRPLKLHFYKDSIQEKKLTLKNYSNKAEKYAIQFGDFLKDSQGKTVFYNSLYTENSCIPYINVFPAIVEADAGETVSIRVIMQVPDSVEESLWGVVYVKNIYENNNIDQVEEKPNVIISPQIAVKVYHHDEVNPKSKIVTTDIRQYKSIKNKIKFDYTIKNTSSNVFSGTVVCIVTDIKTSKELVANKINIEVFPGSDRIVDFDLPEIGNAAKLSIEFIVYDINSNIIDARSTITEQKK